MFRHTLFRPEGLGLSHALRAPPWAFTVHHPHHVSAHALSSPRGIGILAPAPRCDQRTGAGDARVGGGGVRPWARGDEVETLRSTQFRHSTAALNMQVRPVGPTQRRCPARTLPLRRRAAPLPRHPRPALVNARQAVLAQVSRPANSSRRAEPSSSRTRRTRSSRTPRLARQHAFPLSHGLADMQSHTHTRTPSGDAFVHDASRSNPRPMATQPRGIHV